MHFTKPFPSSAHSAPSPDGKYIASLFPSSIAIRSVASLAIVRTIKAAFDLSGGVVNFAWSPSSSRILVAIGDRFHVFSAPDGDFHGNVQIPQPLATKAASVSFGATDDEVCVFSSVGVKLTIVNIASSKIVEISNPKFFNAASASRGCSFRPTTYHLALLTRTAGRDIISIHSAVTREIQQSWCPETVDALGLEWTPDGRWLVVWDSPAHGTRVLFCTHDGHVFKDWRGDQPHYSLDDMDKYGPGIKILTFSPDGRYTAVADGSARISILNSRLVQEVQFHHSSPVEPKETLQIWQEQLDPSAGKRAVPSFIKATQAVSPPSTSPNGASDSRYGCNLAKFDASSSLLASRLDDAPSTIWIWDVPTTELRAVLMYHANIAKVEWHPSQPELLLMRCEGEAYNSIVFIWDPLSNGPRTIDFSRLSPSAKITGRADATWLETTTECAAVFFTSHTRCILLSLADDAEAEAALPWAAYGATNMPADSSTSNSDLDGNESIDMDKAIAELDDTFHFKKPAKP
ncbi:hypothetical protein F4777DRAFT_530000 [Nemania sp. FL0916]|nr:hypothetical protein F4777DRAFT_530000 [Nemania sp. FL0916]